MTNVANSQSHADIALAALRKSNSGATHRIRNATRVNMRTNWCVESGFTAHKKEIAQELSRTRAQS